MLKISYSVHHLLNALGLLVLLVLLTHCNEYYEATANFPDELETIVPSEAMSGPDWRLSSDGTKLYYSSPDGDKNYPNVLLYLETNETYYLDTRRCNARVDWLDERLLACDLHLPGTSSVFDTEERRFLSRSVLKRSEVDLAALLSETGQIYYRSLDALVLLASDPYAEDAKNYIISDDTREGFEAILADYPHLTLPIYPPQADKVFSPDQVYYYTIDEYQPDRTIVQTLTIYTTADDQEVTSFTTEGLRPKNNYRFREAGWAWDSSGVYFSIGVMMGQRYLAIRKLNIPQ